MIPEGTGMKNGVNLAVELNKGEVAGYCIEVVNLDDASPQTGKWDGAVEAENANKAVADPDAMVYIAGIFAGTILFAVSFPVTEPLYHAGSLGVQTLPDALHLPKGLLVLLVVLMALGGFVGAEALERRARKPGATASREREVGQKNSSPADPLVRPAS